MANTNQPKGFRPLNVREAACNQYNMNSAETTKEGDLVYMNPAGAITGTYDAAYPMVGIQAAPFTTNGIVPSTYSAVSGSVVSIWDDPNTEFIGQISSYAATNPVTTWTTSACFDVAGSAGAQYINASASSQDNFRILRLAAEYDTGKISAVGAYAKVVCKINPKGHLASTQS